MRLVHFSKDEDFMPQAIETVGGQGAGCFFYPADDPDGKDTEGYIVSVAD
jgi:hypothetical protein